MLETTIAGSLPKPSWLAEPEKLWAAWRHEGAELERPKQDAALVWLKEQEAVWGLLRHKRVSHLQLDLVTVTRSEPDCRKSLKSANSMQSAT
jgi:hypothetical protein